MRWNDKLILIIAFTSLPVFAAEKISDQRVAIQLIQDADILTVNATSEVMLTDATSSYSFEPGLYTFTPQAITPPEQQFHLFSKTFPLSEPEAEANYIKTWQVRGYPARSMRIGKELLTERGRSLDARINWISLAQEPRLEQAKATQKKLESVEEQWTWMRAETSTPGTGTVMLKGPNGAYSLTLPITLHSQEPLAVDDVDVGFWSERLQHLAYTGTLEITASLAGQLELIEHTPVEEYLRGVLPSEMPALWPEEALKAQAVSARNEVLVNLSTKHTLERFDFCNKEHCRAYHGINRRDPATDRALRHTQGRILVQDDALVQTVFSATCGGWTAGNDTVWFGPPNAALRPVTDSKSKRRKTLTSDSAVRKWLRSSNQAWCAGDSKHFRWTRVFSESEIRGMIEKKVAIGALKRIELGERGEGGRLKWIRVHGSTDTVTIKKELPIRQTLGGLPSALFVMDVSGKAPNRTFTLTGGGRGHGVGLCQHGAKGMADAGHKYPDILLHYFRDVKIEKVR